MANCYQVTELGFEPWQPDPSAILMYIILHHFWGCFYAHFHMISNDLTAVKSFAQSQKEENILACGMIRFMRFLTRLSAKGTFPTMTENK